MKSKKKFLLLGVGVMGALALGVGATSTFAWYNATSAGLTIQGTTNTSIAVQTVTTPIDLAAANLPFNQLFSLSVSEDNSTKNQSLELAHYNGANTAADTTLKLGTGYLDGSGTFKESSVKANTNDVLARQYNAVITIKDNVTTVTDSAGNIWTLNDALKAIYNQSFKIFVDADSKTGERARVFHATAAETIQTGSPDTYDHLVQLDSGALALTNLITQTGSGATATYSKTASASLSYSFYVYVLGDASSADDAAVTGNVRVAVQESNENAPSAYISA